MVSFPKVVEYSDANKPDWISVIKEDPEQDFSLKITIEDYNRLRFDEVNIEGLLVDLQKALTDTGLSVSDVNAIIAFIRFSAPRIYLTLNGTGVDNIEIILPTGVTVADVRKADGTPVPFVFNPIRNSVVITVEFHSIEEIEIIVGNVTNILNQGLNAIVSLMILFGVMRFILEEIYSLPTEIQAEVGA